MECAACSVSFSLLTTSLSALILGVLNGAKCGRETSPTTHPPSCVKKFTNSSLRNGDAGNASLLKRLHSGFRSQA